MLDLGLSPEIRTTDIAAVRIFRGGIVNDYPLITKADSYCTILTFV